MLQIVLVTVQPLHVYFDALDGLLNAALSGRHRVLGKELLHVVQVFGRGEILGHRLAKARDQEARRVARVDCRPVVLHELPAHVGRRFGARRAAHGTNDRNGVLGAYGRRESEIQHLGDQLILGHRAHGARYAHLLLLQVALVVQVNKLVHRFQVAIGQHARVDGRA